MTHTSSCSCNCFWTSICILRASVICMLLQHKELIILNLLCFDNNWIGKLYFTKMVNNPTREVGLYQKGVGVGVGLMDMWGATLLSQPYSLVRKYSLFLAWHALSYLSFFPFRTFFIFSLHYHLQHDVCFLSKKKKDIERKKIPTLFYVHRFHCCLKLFSFLQG